MTAMLGSVRGFLASRILLSRRSPHFLMAKTHPPSTDTSLPPSDESQKLAIVRRLRRIEGQVRGIEQMVEKDRETSEILTQVNAATAGLRAVARESLRRHLRRRMLAVDVADGQGLGREVEALLDDYHRQIR